MVGAELALAVVNGEAMLEIPEFAVGLRVIAQRRAAGGDGIVQNIANGHDQTLGPSPRYAGRFAPWRHAGPPQRLRHIDIAESGDDPLIEQRRLDRRRPPDQRRRQNRHVELIAERFRSQALQARMIVQRVAVAKIEEAEPARVVEGYNGAALDLKAEVIMSAGGRRLGGFNVYTAGHAEMAKNDGVVGERDQNVFGPATDLAHALTGNAFGEIGGQRKSQVGAPHLDRGDGAALDRGGDAAAYGLDFGQFRHGRAL